MLHRSGHKAKSKERKSKALQQEAEGARFELKAQGLVCEVTQGSALGATLLLTQSAHQAEAPRTGPAPFGGCSSATQHHTAAPLPPFCCAPCPTAALLILVHCQHSITSQRIPAQGETALLCTHRDDLASLPQHMTQHSACWWDATRTSQPTDTHGCPLHPP